MDQDAREQAFMSALVTEHFALQGAATATISESSSRSSLYLVTLSSGLVALGFTAGTGDLLLFASAILPVVFLLGCFTIVRLVDTSIENVQALRRISVIRTYYASLLPEAARYFPSTGASSTDAQQMLGIRYTRFSVLFTMASLVGLVNAVVGGAVAGVWIGALQLPRVVPVGAGILVAAVLMTITLIYIARRFAISLPPDAPVEGHA